MQRARKSFLVEEIVKANALSGEVEKMHTGGDARGAVPVTPSTSPLNAVTADPGIECGYHTV